mgnify:CR=1 FL=1
MSNAHAYDLPVVAPPKAAIEPAYVTPHDRGEAGTVAVALCPVQHATDILEHHLGMPGMVWGRCPAEMANVPQQSTSCMQEFNYTHMTHHDPVEIQQYPSHEPEHYASGMEEYPSLNPRAQTGSMRRSYGHYGHYGTRCDPMHPATGSNTRRCDGFYDHYDDLKK